MKSTFRIAGVVILAMIGTCLVPILTGSSGDLESTAAEKIRFEYPEPWTRMGLPKIPEGEVVSQTAGNFRRGLSFEVSVKSTPDEVAEYFEAELHQRWFDFFMSDLTADGSYLNQFKSDDVQITINAIPDRRHKNRSTVRIGMRQGLSRQAPASFSSVRAD